MCSVLGSSPSCRWIVNFDLDFMDGLVLASLLAAYVPFLVCQLLRIRPLATLSGAAQHFEIAIIVPLLWFSVFREFQHLLVRVPFDNLAPIYQNSNIEHLSGLLLRPKWRLKIALLQFRLVEGALKFYSCSVMY